MRITWAWQQALARPPRVEEMAVVQEVLRKHLAEYESDPTAADALLNVGPAPVPEGIKRSELAAWMSVTRILLNLHETITRS